MSEDRMTIETLRAQLRQAREGYERALHGNHRLQRRVTQLEQACHAYRRQAQEARAELEQARTVTTRLRERLEAPEEMS